MSISIITSSSIRNEGFDRNVLMLFDTIFHLDFLFITPTYMNLPIKYPKLFRIFQNKMTDSKNIVDLDERRKLIATSISSPISSVIARYITHPIDTIKSKVQARATHLHTVSQYRFGHSIQLAKQTWKNEGIAGFFRGVTISAFGSIIAFTAYMQAYERSKTYMSQYEFFKQYGWANHLLAGFIAQFFSCAFWLPIDIIKERLQVQSEVKIYSYSGPKEAMKKIKNTEGIIGLYRAFGATLVFFGPASAIFFVAYEQLKDHFVVDQKKPTLSQSILCSAGAGAISGFLTTPMEMVKLRMQIQRADRATKGGKMEDTLYGYRNIFHGLMVAYQKEGFLALFKGAGLRVLFTIPIWSLSIGLTEYFRNVAIHSGLIQPFL